MLFPLPKGPWMSRTASTACEWQWVHQALNPKAQTPSLTPSISYPEKLETCEGPLRRACRAMRHTTPQLSDAMPAGKHVGL